MAFTIFPLPPWAAVQLQVPYTFYVLGLWISGFLLI